MPLTPLYDLDEVKALINAVLENPTIAKIYFTARPKSVDAVISEFQKIGKYLDPLASEIYIFESILELSCEDFYKTQSQWEDAFADIYGIVKDDIPWFVKFILGKDELGEKCLEQISFHRAVGDMKLANGTTIKTDGSYS